MEKADVEKKERTQDMLIKITLKQIGYGTQDKSFILPDSAHNDYLLQALAQSKEVTTKQIGDYNGEHVFVINPLQGIDVQLIDAESVMTNRDYQIKNAEFLQKKANEEQEKANLAKRAIELSYLTANQVAALIDVYRYGNVKEIISDTKQKDKETLIASGYILPLGSNGFEMTPLGKDRIKAILGEV